MTIDTVAISAAVTEAQAIVEMVMHRLRATDGHEAFTAWASLHCASQRLDAVHDALALEVEHAD